MVIISGGTHTMFGFIDYISTFVFINFLHEHIFLLNVREKKNNKHCLKHRKIQKI